MIVAKTRLKEKPKTCRQCLFRMTDPQNGEDICRITRAFCPWENKPDGVFGLGKPDWCPLMDEVQEWISVDDRLPEENEYVMIWCGELQIAKIEKGISKKERELMKNGEINDPVEIGWNASGGYRQLRRSELYRACDEGWNNRVPYCWYVNGGMMKLFGQNVTHWMPIHLQPPKGE